MACPFEAGRKEVEDDGSPPTTGVSPHARALGQLMCGRYSVASPAELVEEAFDLAEAPELAQRFNVAPTQEAPVVRAGREGGRSLSHLRWGLIPVRASDPAAGGQRINARAETVAEKPSFAPSFRRRRCLVVADGFYEWKPAGGFKQPWYFHARDDRPIAFAGLWDRWQDRHGDREIESFTIVTTVANDALAHVHERMPVILGTEAYDLWLDPAIYDPDRLLPVLRPAGDDLLRGYPVSTRVNKVANDSPECIVRVEPVVQLEFGW